MIILLTILDWLTISLVFYPIVIILSIIAICFGRALDKFYYAPIYLALIIAGLTYYKFPELRQYVTIQNSCIAIAIYLLIGGGVSIIKWIGYSREFREIAMSQINRAKDKVAENNIFNDRRDNGLSAKSTDYSSILLDLVRDAVKDKYHYKLGKETPYEVYVSSSAMHPVPVRRIMMSYIVYWPMFSLAIVVDEVVRYIEWFTDLFGNVYKAIAKRYSVSIDVNNKFN